ncbi:MAG: hypothetical protein Q8S00_25570 [Deltaproteobacteria bacterium]|nr:hypothetical protein [Deltaproteobacteria bacterium]
MNAVMLHIEQLDDLRRIPLGLGIRQLKTEFSPTKFFESLHFIFIGNRKYHSSAIASKCPGQSHLPDPLSKIVAWHASKVAGDFNTITLGMTG